MRWEGEEGGGRTQVGGKREGGRAQVRGWEKRGMESVPGEMGEGGSGEADPGEMGWRWGIGCGWGGGEERWDRGKGA